MAETAVRWRNRITRYADVPPEDLLANPKNWRIHPRHQQDALSGTIKEVGYVDPITVQDGTDTVIDGHLRVTLALRDGIPTIPVAYVDLDDDEADLVLATHDPIAAMAAADQRQLDDLLAGLAAEDESVRDLLDQLASGADLTPFDPAAEWQGMPEFHQDDLMPVKQVIVNFGSEAAVEAFGRLLEQDVTMTTKSVWYPARQTEHRLDRAYVVTDDADAA